MTTRNATRKSQPKTEETVFTPAIVEGGFALCKAGIRRNSKGQLEIYLPAEAMDLVGRPVQLDANGLCQSRWENRHIRVFTKPVRQSLPEKVQAKRQLDADIKTGDLSKILS